VLLQVQTGVQVLVQELQIAVGQTAVEQIVVGQIAVEKIAVGQTAEEQTAEAD